MTTFHIESEGFDDIASRYGRNRTLVLGALNRSLRKIGGVMVPALKGNTPVRTGKLRASTRFQIKGTAEDQVLEIRQGARTAEGVFYRPFVTAGTRPHDIVPRTKKALKFNVGGRTVFAKRVRHPGTKANPYHKRTVREQMPAMRKILNDEALTVTARLAE